MPTLTLFEDYSREDVHDIFDPDSKFTPHSGMWGLQGPVPIRGRSGDFVFFVTFGKKEGDHTYRDLITADGVLQWESQKKQDPNSAQVRTWIDHDSDTNSIYLFLRTAQKRDGVVPPYTYLGRLKYIEHNPQSARPVHFRWQLLDWPIPLEVQKRMQLALLEISDSDPQVTPDGNPPIEPGGFVQVAPPAQLKTDGVNGRRFGGVARPNHAERDQKNRALGEAGELLVLKNEIMSLRTNGHPDLADRVRHVAKVEGDHAGYDIASFFDDGRTKFIEVKTTKGPITTDFFISANELKLSRTCPDAYVLVRVFDYSPQTESASWYQISGEELHQLSLTPIAYRISRLVRSESQ